MARPKRKSTILETSRQRLAGLKKITSTNFGPGLTREGYEQEIDGYSDDQESDNGDVAALDEKGNRLDTREQGLADLNQRVLAAVKAQFDPDSNEYELVGGVRRSDRKKPTRKPKRGGGSTTRQPIDDWLSKTKAVEAKRGTSTAFLDVRSSGRLK
jgi:hypothetical protein